MRAAVVPKLGAKWEVRDLPTPKPSTNQVLIRIRASGLCYTDVHITNGHLPTEFPRTLGHEPAGEIVETGQGVTRRKIGDRVGVPWVQTSCGRCEWCMRGKPMFCAEHLGTGVQTQGSHAEYMLAYADSTMLLPEGLSYEQAAPIFCAGYTVWGGLRFADPKPHESIAVVGIGGLGHLAVQYSKAAGFKTIAVTHSPDKKELAGKLGSDIVVSNGEELRSAGGADVLLATSNSYQSVTDALKGLRPDGRAVIMGVSTDPLSLTAGDLIGKRIRIIGSQQNGSEYLYEALDYVAKGKVKPIIETYPLSGIAQAYDKVANGTVRFRAVIKT
ncbi:MAG: alcohol dehydrogenase catalytic domain-containing protein [Candidatus Bathyarchaeia archaeon]